MQNRDSFEWDLNEYRSAEQNEAEALPLKLDINLSDIWIPMHLLPNRQTVINLNEDKLSMFHTLERPEVRDQFSVYENNPSCFPLYESEISHSIHEAFSEEKLQNDNGLEVDASQCNYLTLKNESNLEFNSSNFNLSNQISNDKSVKDKTPNLNLKDQSTNGEQNVQFGDIDNIDKFIANLTDSLEEIYYSDEEDNQYIYDNENELSDRENEQFENFVDVNTLEKIKHCDKEFEETLTKDLQIPENKLCNPIQTHKIEDMKLPKQNSFYNILCDEQSIETPESTLATNPDLNAPERVKEGIQKFPIAYKRPALEALPVKSKTQKEKKNKKKQKRNLLLENFNQDDSEYKQSGVDEFYDHILRQRNVQLHEQILNPNEFPSLNQEHFHENSIYDNEYPIKDTYNELNSKTLVKTSSNDPKSNYKDIDSKFKESGRDTSSTPTIIIENIPHGVNKDQIESIVLGYGELKKLHIQPNGKFQKAKLEMDFICEVDWIVDCLNDSQPFGIFGEEKLKCYKLLV